MAKGGKGGLGRGLGSLLAGYEAAMLDADNGAAAGGLSGGPSSATGLIEEVPVDSVRPHPDQPRKRFDEEELAGLSASIAKDGLLQPLLVRKSGDGYEIIAGERRWQASRMAGLSVVPVRVLEADDIRVCELAMIENLQRSDLNPIEEAYGYRRMMELGDKTQAEVAEAVSKGRSTIANSLRLLDLPERTQELLHEGVITAGHARAVLSVPSEEAMLKLTDKIVEGKLSVRQAESLARLYAGRQKEGAAARRRTVPPTYRKTARTLGRAFDTKVRIRSANGKNKIEIEFADESDLKRIFDKMNLEDER